MPGRGKEAIGGDLVPVARREHVPRGDQCRQRFDAGHQHQSQQRDETGEGDECPDQERQRPPPAAQIQRLIGSPAAHCGGDETLLGAEHSAADEQQQRDDHEQKYRSGADEGGVGNHAVAPGAVEIAGVQMDVRRRAQEQGDPEYLKRQRENQHRTVEDCWAKHRQRDPSNHLQRPGSSTAGSVLQCGVGALQRRLAGKERDRDRDRRAQHRHARYRGEIPHGQVQVAADQSGQVPALPIDGYPADDQPQRRDHHRCEQQRRVDPTARHVRAAAEDRERRPSRHREDGGEARELQCVADGPPERRIAEERPVPLQGEHPTGQVIPDSSSGGIRPGTRPS
jgi:hypothetical protein